ncbi:MAG: choice-of-anchor Q domain-containing protein [Chitinophagaceae bacterium]
MKLFCYLMLIIIILHSCSKDSFISSKEASISFSSDTIRFDTVFTTVGSITQSFKIKNDNNERLLINSIVLTGGQASPFKMNVDGISGTTINNIEIGAKDSLYVFVSVTLNSNTNSVAFIVQDSIQVTFNGNQRFVQLETWGKNANFLKEHVVRGHETWNSKLPYVIVGGLIVDSNAVLTIEKGCKIFMHANAPIIIDGTLQVNGERSDSDRVYFQADRLDAPYNAFPGSWPGIYFRGSSTGSVLNYAIIQNAYQGIVAEKLPGAGGYKVVMNQCIINNIYDAGILGVQTSIQATNCLISNCGKNIQLLYGGNYLFNHCTVASYSSTYMLHKDPLVAISNNTGQTAPVLVADLRAIFRNTIFWSDGGAVEDEIPVSKAGANPFLLQFENCLIKGKTDPANSITTNMIRNQEPLFDSIEVSRPFYNFRLKTNSPALNKGVATPIMLDLDGLQRPVGIADIGAYERR